MGLLLRKFLTAVVIIAGLVGPRPSFGAVANVLVNNSNFTPATTNINSGDSVIWTWPAGSNTHNVTSTSTPQAWTASATLNAGAKFTNTFSTRGTFPYRCTVHGFTGQIIVVTNPPSVLITNPAAGKLFAAPANVTILATASDPNSGGSITNVQFLVGTNVLANVKNPPFAAVTNNLGSGSYALKAVATDNFGLKATNSISIVVDALPAIAITNPAPGTVFAEPASVMVQASATDADGTVTNVQFLMGTNSLISVTNPPFAAAASNLSAGSYVMSAIATDNSGLTATNSITLSVVSPLPLVLGTLAKPSSSTFQLNYPANLGLTYIVQKSTNLQAGNWTTLFTNMATNSPVTFVDTNAAVNPTFYRIGRLPNP